MIPGVLVMGIDRHFARYCEPMSRRPLLAPLALAAAMALFPPVSAAGMLEQLLAAKKPGSGRDYDARTLAPDALRKCLVEAWEYDTTAGAMVQEKARLADERKALVELSGQLGANKDAILSPAENKRHNDRVAQFQARHKAFNAAVEAANGQAASATAKGQSVQKDCQGRNYLGADLQGLAPTLPEGLQKALPVKP